MKESAIQKQILEYLSAERILAFRMNSGAMSGEYNGKTRFIWSRGYWGGSIMDTMSVPQALLFVTALAADDCKYGKP
jgi:hypothetical protein